MSSHHGSKRKRQTTELCQWVDAWLFFGSSAASDSPRRERRYAASGKPTHKMCKLREVDAGANWANLFRQSITLPSSVDSFNILLRYQVKNFKCLRTGLGQASQ